jgi:hypothetical protein
MLFPVNNSFTGTVNRAGSKSSKFYIFINMSSPEMVKTKFRWVANYQQVFFPSEENLFVQSDFLCLLQRREQTTVMRTGAKNMTPLLRLIDSVLCRANDDSSPDGTCLIMMINSSVRLMLNIPRFTAPCRDCRMRFFRAFFHLNNKPVFWLFF